MKSHHLLLKSGLGITGIALLLNACAQEMLPTPSLSPLTLAAPAPSLPRLDLVPEAEKLHLRLQDSGQARPLLSEIDPEQVALAIFETHLAELTKNQGNPTAAELLKSMRELVDAVPSAARQDPHAFKAALESALEAKVGKTIEYDASSLLLTQVLNDGTLQCHSGTVFYLVALWLANPELMESKNMVAAFGSGHITPASMYWNGRAWAIRGIEMTFAGRGEIDFGSLQKGIDEGGEVRIVDARQFLISEVYKEWSDGAEVLAFAQAALTQTETRFLIKNNPLAKLEDFYPVRPNGRLPKNVSPFSFGTPISTKKGPRKKVDRLDTSKMKRSGKRGANPQESQERSEHAFSSSPAQPTAKGYAPTAGNAFPYDSYTYHGTRIRQLGSTPIRVEATRSAAGFQWPEMYSGYVTYFEFTGESNEAREREECKQLGGVLYFPKNASTALPLRESTATAQISEYMQRLRTSASVQGGICAIKH